MRLVYILLIWQENCGQLCRQRDRERNIQKLTQNWGLGKEKQLQRGRVYCCSETLTATLENRMMSKMSQKSPGLDWLFYLTSKHCLIGNCQFTIMLFLLGKMIHFNILYLFLYLFFLYKFCGIMQSIQEWGRTTRINFLSLPQVKNLRFTWTLREFLN